MNAEKELITDLDLKQMVFDPLLIGTVGLQPYRNVSRKNTI